jgi:AbrB family looped-hinge helix DNA binding protein
MAYGIVTGMEVRIDKAGRIVVPKPLRERLGFKPDTELEALSGRRGVLLKRVQQRPSMVKVDGLWVHQGSAEQGANWERMVSVAVRGLRSVVSWKGFCGFSAAALVGANQGPLASYFFDPR